MTIGHHSFWTVRNPLPDRLASTASAGEPAVPSRSAQVGRSDVLYEHELRELAPA